MITEAERMSRRSLKRLISAEKELEFTSALLLFIYFFIFILAFLLIQQKIIKPIIRLQHNAKQLAFGDYDSRIPIIGKDELSALARSYNTLASEIKIKISAVTDKSKRLTDSQKRVIALK